MRGSTLIEAARGYADLGLSVIPTRGKRPAIQSWEPYTTNRATSDEIDRWFSREDIDGIAVICGPVSGNLVCRDFDAPESYERWEIEWSNISDLFAIAQTGEGWHVYLVGDPQYLAVRCGTPCCKNLGDGEIRFNGVYCVVPPSMHPNGRRYEWKRPLNDTLPFVDPFAIGLAHDVTEHTEQTEQTEQGSGDSNCSVCSVCSVTPAVERAIQNVIAATLPTGPRQRNRQIWQFVRALKAIPELAGASAQDLRPIVREWHRRALAFIRTRPFEETWLDFVVAWDRALYPKGAEPIMLAVKAATVDDLPGAAVQYDQPAVHRLIAVCRELQRQAGTAPFFLSCRTAASLLGVEHNTAARWLRLLVLDDVLAIAKRATARRATRYRYLLELE